MSAERLREAAMLLRERAEAATPGPWHADRFSRVGSQVNGGFSDVGGTVFADRATDLAEATFIATMDPTVALAVADWLSEADEYYGHDTRTDRAALAAADAILAGGAS